MEKLVCMRNIRDFAYVNDRVCTRPVRGIIVDFMGLNGSAMFSGETVEGEYYGAEGILFIVPYANPWAWMNRATVQFADELVAAVTEGLDLPPDLPIVASGGSMGGLSAIVYTMYAARTPVLCAANCPVCDAVYHFHERPDLPRTMYSALYEYEGTLEEALKTISPLHLAEKLPRIPYFIIHCDKDSMVALDKHSEPFAKVMKAAGRDVTLEIVRGRDHCDIGLAGRRSYAAHIMKAFG